MSWYNKKIKIAGIETPFNVLKNDRILTEEELIRAIRSMVSAEYDGIRLYMQLSESTDNELAQKTLREIADEERVHAGEFLRLLKELTPEEQDFYDEGTDEVEKKMKED